MRTTIFSLFLGVSLCASVIHAQSPMPVVVPAATATVIPKATAVTTDDGNSAALLKTLQEIKAANEETLQKQAATLSQLDEMEKNAEQLRIFTRRS